MLTRGGPLSWSHLLTSIQTTDHLFTGVFDPGGKSDKLIGQVYQSSRMNSAHLDYVLLTEESDLADLASLLEGLIVAVGRWGGKQVVADLGTDSELFPQFRRAGFSVLAKQRVFQCRMGGMDQKPLKRSWQIWTRDDIPAVRRLYLSLVPTLIQPAEPLTRREMLGMVYYDEDGVLQAYADMVYGPKGAWVLPIVHPHTPENISDLLTGLMVDLPPLNGRPLYVTVRSYQPWVEHALESLSAEPSPEQAILVRYLALHQRVETEFPFAVVENGKPEPTFPLAPIKHHQK